MKLPRSRNLGMLLILLGLRLGAAEQTKLPGLEEVLNSKRDLWGEAALKQTNGPTYEFFAGLLAPPRYVNADFRYYPIVLSAPRNAIKARLISNGSAINARGGARSWNDAGTPVTFRVGNDELRFGEYPERLHEPTCLKGYLPVVQIQYEHGEAVYQEEAFAAIAPDLATQGVVFVRFSLVRGSEGAVAAEVDSKSELKPAKGSLIDENGQAAVWFDANWKWQRQRLVVNLASNATALLAVAIRPMPRHNAPLTAADYDAARQGCITTWENILQSGMQVDVPEAMVTNAWRASVIGNIALIHTNRMHYSAGNQYDHLYEAEGSDATESLLVWGQTNLARALIPPLLSFTRKGLEFHQAGHKLQLLTHYFWLTRDAEFLKAQMPRWTNELQLILNSRTNAEGLFPREQYCGDIATPVFSLNSNAKCWRALRDLAPVLTALGQSNQAQICLSNAATFRSNILAAVVKSERMQTQSSFIPIALFGEEEPYDVITASKIGSYWNLMANYVLGARPFGLRSERENSLIEYVEQHGGLCMGLIRSRPAPTFWTGLSSINPLYGQRRISTLLERDEPDKVLVAFYGMLAQGLTRNTFIGAEGCSLTPLDERGRLFYCPPNSASSGFLLNMLRGMLVQDLDLDDDGRPETLRLLFATPRAWLDDGKTIAVERAPTAFGPVSVRVASHLKAGDITAEIQMPPQLPDHTFLRLRLPVGWNATSAKLGDREVPLDQTSAVDLTGATGKITVRVAVAAAQPP